MADEKYDEEFRKKRAFIPNLEIKDPLEWELAEWVMKARSQRLWSMKDQIKLLQKWNAQWDKAIGQ